MGLFSFLKGKFSKKGEAKIDAKEEASRDIYSKGMEKSRKNFASRLDELSKRYAKVNAEYFEELEEILIESDVGVDLSLRLSEKLLDVAKAENLTDPKELNERLVDEMFVGYVTKGEAIQNEISFVPNGPTVLLVCGVNGVGKTTSIAKLAYRYIQQGKKVLLVAGDTFRAGAVEQLAVWADRLGCPIVMGKAESDPASVAYDGAKYALEHGIDLMIVDTAGRLQTKANLMQELAKIRRVLGREIEGAPHESFLIIDGTTGQNGVLQAKAFKEVTDLTGIVITKMDGTSKGGIILSIRDELGIPVRFLGLGETMADLQEFDLDKYLYGLLLGKRPMREDVLLDREHVLDLLESYESLLTAKQKEAVDAYYRYDLSLGEISEQTGTSRAAVNDAVKKTIAKLEDFERKLGLLQKKEGWAKKKQDIDLLPLEERLASYQTLLEEIVHGI